MISIKEEIIVILYMIIARTFKYTDIFLLIVEEQLLLLHHMKTCSIRLITAESILCQIKIIYSVVSFAQPSTSP